MAEKLIYGIQQIGVGVDDVEKAFRWYATKFGSDVSIFDDNNEATYMAPYMGGKPHKKRAILAMNMQGGSGYELWQYTDRTPQKPETPVQLGDYGIAVAKIKSRDITKSFQQLKDDGVQMLSDIVETPDGRKSFYVMDPFGNMLQIIEYDSWYASLKNHSGGPFGCIIGVSDIEKSLKLYADILGYSNVKYDISDKFQDLGSLPGGGGKFRRVLLTHNQDRTGGFSPLLGNSEIELVQGFDIKPKKIFENRYWGDIGFIHLCFDMRNMEALVEECAEKGFPFTVRSGGAFDMGDANGDWGYLEDPDGTLIEFVQTNKVPLIKAINWNINLTKRDPHKPLPNWLIKAMSINRVKFKN